VLQVLFIPLDRLVQSSLEIIFGVIAEDGAGFCDVGIAVLDVAGTVGTEMGFSCFTCLVVAGIPLGEGAEALAEGGGGVEAEVSFQGCGVCVGDGHVAGLHGDEFLVSLEIIVGGEHPCGDKLFLKDGDEVQQVLWGAVADVIDFVGRNRQAVFASLLFGCMLHDADNAFYDVIDEGEVALAVAVVEDLDGLAFAQLVGEAEVCHVRASGGAIDGEEAQAGRGDVVELAVGMCQKLVALLRGGVEADRVIHLVVGGVGHLLVAAIDAAAAGIDEVLHAVVAAGLQDVVETDEVALYVGIGVLDAVAYTGLGCEVDHNGWLVFREEAFDTLLVGDGVFDERPVAAKGFYPCQALILEVHIVVVGDGVDANDLDVFEVLEEANDEVAANETSGSRHKNRLAFK